MRILQPHQTISERNLSVLSGSDRTIWLRTCYAPELDDVYQDMAQGVAGFIVDANAFLDDATLYDFKMRGTKYYFAFLRCGTGINGKPSTKIQTHGFTMKTGRLRLTLALPCTTPVTERSS
jgi:hypothetical protein